MQTQTESGAQVRPSRRARTRLHLGIVSAGIIAAWLASFAPPARAQDLSSTEAVRALDARNADEIRAGIESMGLAGSARSVPALERRIRRGLPPTLLRLAVDTLAMIGSRDAGPILLELLSHRRAEIRLAAIQGLVACRPRDTARALEAALSDPDAGVRAAAAGGLGQVGARAAVPTLFRALDRGILEAAMAIGQLASAAQVETLLGYVGRLPLDALTPGLMEILARDDIPERTKLGVIHHLGELASPEVRIFLEALLDFLPPEGNDALREAAEQIAMRIAQ